MGRVSTASWCRNKRFSSTRSPRSRKAARSVRNASHTKASIAEASPIWCAFGTREVLPSHNLDNGIERDHQPLKQRLRPMRGFKRLRSADTVTRGHALVQNLRNSCSSLTAGVPHQLRLAAAWPELLRVI
ncbi:MAG: DDE-type integrase/transposase/recombinase [Chloroflexota bacterium]